VRREGWPDLDTVSGFGRPPGPPGVTLFPVMRTGVSRPGGVAHDGWPIPASSEVLEQAGDGVAAAVVWPGVTGGGRIGGGWLRQGLAPVFPVGVGVSIVRRALPVQTPSELLGSSV
jgi:hypothetical protein